jgi:hypothetical protein
MHGLDGRELRPDGELFALGSMAATTAHELDSVAQRNASVLRGTSSAGRDAPVGAQKKRRRKR